VTVIQGRCAAVRQPRAGVPSVPRYATLRWNNRSGVGSVPSSSDGHHPPETPPTTRMPTPQAQELTQRRSRGNLTLLGLDRDSPPRLEPSQRISFSHDLAHRDSRPWRHGSTYGGGGRVTAALAPSTERGGHRDRPPPRDLAARVSQPGSAAGKRRRQAARITGWGPGSRWSRCRHGSVRWGSERRGVREGCASRL
jgi:hypothetical protein